MPLSIEGRSKRESRSPQIFSRQRQSQLSQTREPVQKEILDTTTQHDMKFGGDIKFKKDTLKEVMIDVNKKKKKDFRRI